MSWLDIFPFHWNQSEPRSPVLLGLENALSVANTVVLFFVTLFIWTSSFSSMFKFLVQCVVWKKGMIVFRFLL